MTIYDLVQGLLACFLQLLHPIRSPNMYHHQVWPLHWALNDLGHWLWCGASAGVFWRDWARLQHGQTSLLLARQRVRPWCKQNKVLVGDHQQEEWVTSSITSAGIPGQGNWSAGVGRHSHVSPGHSGDSLSSPLLGSGPVPFLLSFWRTTFQTSRAPFINCLPFPPFLLSAPIPTFIPLSSSKSLFSFSFFLFFKIALLK